MPAAAAPYGEGPAQVGCRQGKPWDCIQAKEGIRTVHKWGAAGTSVRTLWASHFEWRLDGLIGALWVTIPGAV